MQDANNDRLGISLRALPRQRARDGFASAVRQQYARRRKSRRRVVAMTALILTFVAGWAYQQWHQSELQRDQALARIEVRTRLESLLAEQRNLERELAALRRLTAQAQPVIRIESTDRIDYVVDLERISQQVSLATYKLPPQAPNN